MPKLMLKMSILVINHAARLWKRGQRP